ncbi:MAG: YncE family protein [Candidatus Zixiibacteriota bacterium]
MKTAKLILAGATLLLITGCKHPGPIDNTEISSPVKLYVANSGDGTISVIDVSENEVTKTIPVGLKPAAIAVSTERKRAYVANFMSKSVSVIDTETDAVRNTISLPGHPVHLVAGDSMVYVIVDHDTTIGNDAYIAGVTLDEEVFVDSLYRDSRCNSMQHLAYSSTGFLYGASLIILTCDPPLPRPFTVNTKTGHVLNGNSLSSRIIKLSEKTFSEF